MKRLITAAFAALMIMSGCEYHPYYDGQKLRVYNMEYGVIEADGTHLYVPIVGRHAFEIEIYGGAGKNHKVTLADQEYFRYTYNAKTAFFIFLYVCLKSFVSMKWYRLYANVSPYMVPFSPSSNVM